MTNLSPIVRKFGQPVLLRAIVFFALWLVLTLGEPADLAAGIFATIAAVWASLYLLPPSPLHLSLAALLRFILRFFRQSVLAGVDVAWRALDPRLPLHPGYVQFPSRLARGSARNAFCTLECLLPGTLPVESDQSGMLLIHCLDVDQPVVADLAKDEHLFRRALGEQSDNG